MDAVGPEVAKELGIEVGEGQEPETGEELGPNVGDRLGGYTFGACAVGDDCVGVIVDDWVGVVGGLPGTHCE